MAINSKFISVHYCFVAVWLSPYSLGKHVYSDWMSVICPGVAAGIQEQCLVLN